MARISNILHLVTTPITHLVNLAVLLVLVQDESPQDMLLNAQANGYGYYICAMTWITRSIFEYYIK